MTLRQLALLLAVVLCAACTPSTEPSATASPTESPAAPIGNLPPGCGQIDLRTPRGDPVELDGTWTQDVSAGSPPVTWWIRTFGDCVWGVGRVDAFLTDPVANRPDSAQNLQGHIGTNFVIEGDVVLVGPPDPLLGLVPIYAPVRLLIEIDEDGQISLREDRVYGVEGVRCVAASGLCLRPLLLRRAGAVN